MSILAWVPLFPPLQLWMESKQNILFLYRRLLFFSVKKRILKRWHRHSAKSSGRSHKSKKKKHHNRLKENPVHHETSSDIPKQSTHAFGNLINTKRQPSIDVFHAGELPFLLFSLLLLLVDYHGGSLSLKAVPDTKKLVPQTVTYDKCPHSFINSDLGTFMCTEGEHGRKQLF